MFRALCLILDVPRCVRLKGEVSCYIKIVLYHVCSLRLKCLWFCPARAARVGCVGVCSVSWCVVCIRWHKNEASDIDYNKRFVQLRSYKKRYIKTLKYACNMCFIYHNMYL